MENLLPYVISAYQNENISFFQVLFSVFSNPSFVSATGRKKTAKQASDKFIIIKSEF
jgi:hypothetical protein